MTQACSGAPSRCARSSPALSPGSPRCSRSTRSSAPTSRGNDRPKPEPSSTVSISLTRKRPEWMRVKARMDDDFLELKKLVRDHDLHTVCEEAGCPNIYECWSDRTATFMILGDRCTRACGFCLVDTRKPLGGRSGRTAARRRRDRHARPRARGDHVRRARRLARWWRLGVRGDRRRGAGDEPRTPRSSC